jgi:hypothetical protein
MPKLTVSMLGQKISDLDSEVKYLVQKAKMVKAEQERARRLAEAEALKQAAKEAAAKKKAAAADGNNETVAEEGGEEEAVPTEAPGTTRKKGPVECCTQCGGSGASSKTVWIRILPFSHKGVERTEIMLENKILTQNFCKK